MNNDPFLNMLIMGAALGAGGAFVFDILRGKLPGIVGLVPAAGVGALLGAMFYVFRTGVVNG